MYGFILKKNFCDGWDNLLSVVITNAICLLSGFGIVFLFLGIGKTIPESGPQIFHFILLGAAFIFACIHFSILAFAYGETAAKIANFEGIHILDYFKAIPGVLKDASLFGLLLAAIVIVSVFGFDFYFIRSQSLIGFFAGGILFWIDIFCLLSFQWFIPIRSLMNNNFSKCLKKCFIIFFDNTGYSIFWFLHNIIMLIPTVLMFGFCPSVAGLLIANTNALRIRLYKYDYLEEHPELKTKKERRQIPWEDLIYDDREALGPRKLKSFLFPWKE
ncbi:MAG: hypothetical protein K5829_01270 [Treponema sp.]|nr:hypothetical protein [Treponema sp.]